MIYCPVCNESLGANVQYCRKCGSRLSATDPEITRPLAEDGIRNVSAPFFPPSGNRVVLISSPVTQVLKSTQTAGSDVASLINIPQIRGFPEEPLGFSIEPTILPPGVELVLQPRGLLQLKESYQSETSVHEVLVDHLDLNFARKEVVYAPIGNYEATRALDTKGHERIRLRKVESVAYKRRLLKTLLVITLTPADYYCEFIKVDPVMRQIVLQISTGQISLAKRIASAVNLYISQKKLEGMISPPKAGPS